MRAVLRDLLAGATLVLRGFALWRRRPGLMAFGMLPAVIAALVIGIALLALGINVTAIASGLTPFAQQWAEADRSLLRGLLALVLIAGAATITVYGFTTLTLLIGDPFYERIWRAVENDLGGYEAAPLRFSRTLGDGILLVLRAIGYALTAFAVGLIPLVGSVAAAILGPTLAGHLIARELTGRPFAARGIGDAERRQALRGSRARELGFGVMTQLFFLVPGGAIVVMPAAVVGATYLARSITQPVVTTTP